MTEQEYKALVSRVYKKYHKVLAMDYAEACEVCDDVYFGKSTERKLFQQLELAEQEEQTTGCWEWKNGNCVAC